MGINQCARSGERTSASTSSSRAYLMGAAVQLDLQELRSIARGEFAGKGAVTGTTGVADVARYAAKAPELRQLRPLRVQNTSLEKEAVGGGASGAVPSQERSLFDPEALQAEADRRNREAAKAGQTDRFCGCGQLATVAIGCCRPSSSNPEGRQAVALSRMFRRLGRGSAKPKLDSLDADDHKRRAGAEPCLPLRRIGDRRNRTSQGHVALPRMLRGVEGTADAGHSPLSAWKSRRFFLTALFDS